jgi:hypothetical protein
VGTTALTLKRLEFGIAVAKREAVFVLHRAEHVTGMERLERRTEAHDGDVRLRRIAHDRPAHLARRENWVEPSR